MDNVDALAKAMTGKVFMDTESNERIAKAIVLDLYEAGFRITKVSKGERDAVQTIKAIMDPLPKESQQKIVARLVNG